MNTINYRLFGNYITVRNRYHTRNGIAIMTIYGKPGTYPYIMMDDQGHVNGKATRSGFSLSGRKDGLSIMTFFNDLFIGTSTLALYYY